MKIAIAGTSNSLIRDGWVYGLRDSPSVLSVINHSTGGSSSLLLARIKSDHDISDCDFVLMDFAPNESFFFRRERSSYADIRDYVLDFVAANLGVTPVMILMPTIASLYGDQGAYTALRRVADAHGIPVIDGVEFVKREAGLMGLMPDNFMSDPDHMTRETAYRFGAFVAAELLKIDRTIYRVKPAEISQSHFMRITGNDMRRRATSVIGADFVRIMGDDQITLEFDDEVTFVGLGVNIAQTSGRVHFETERGKVGAHLTHAKHYDPQNQDNEKSLLYMIRPLGPVSGRSLTISVDTKEGDDGIAEISGVIYKTAPETVSVPIRSYGYFSELMNAFTEMGE